MELLLFFMVCIMFFLTTRYNHYDCLENPFLDLLIVTIHIITIGYIFYTLVSINSPFIALFCAYVLFKNIDWFIQCIKGEDTEEDAQEDNKKDKKENKNECEEEIENNKK